MMFVGGSYRNSWMIGSAILLLVGSAISLRAQTSTEPAAAPPPNLKIVKLLWKAQPSGAGTALEKAIDQALTRREVAQLKPHLGPLSAQLLEAVALESRDPRWVPAVAALAIIDQAPGPQLLSQAVTQSPDPIAIGLPKRELSLRAWLAIDPEKAKAYAQQLIASPKDWSKSAPAEIEWFEIVVLRGLEADKTNTTDALLSRWSAIPRAVQLSAIEPLSQSADSMKRLIAEIAAGRIAKDLLNTNQLLKWNSTDDAELNAAIAKVWGKLRSSDDTNRKQVVADTLKLLKEGNSGNPVAGEAHFKRICFQCHKLHGQGMEVGPDITSNGRGSFEQLVSNVMDPSLVIGPAFTSKTVLTTDGRVLAGLVAASDEKRLTLKVQGGKLVELDREEDIEQIKDSDKSLMPDGLEQQMNRQELLDLFAYLSLTKPLTAPENDTIPGTPDKLTEGR